MKNNRGAPSNQHCQLIFYQLSFVSVANFFISICWILGYLSNINVKCNLYFFLRELLDCWWNASTEAIFWGIFLLFCILVCFYVICILYFYALVYHFSLCLLWPPCFYNAISDFWITCFPKLWIEWHFLWSCEIQLSQIFPNSAMKLVC